MKAITFLCTEESNIKPRNNGKYFFRINKKRLIKKFVIRKLIILGVVRNADTTEEKGKKN